MGESIESTQNYQIANSYNIGDISSSDGYNVAGIIGAAHNITIENCYSIGSLIGIGNVGNFYGYEGDNCFIQNCYSLDSEFTNVNLGNAFKIDLENINMGYPILYWE